MQWMKKEKNECKTEKMNAINAKKKKRMNVFCVCVNNLKLNTVHVPIAE